MLKVTAPMKTGTGITGVAMEIIVISAIKNFNLVVTEVMKAAMVVIIVIAATTETAAVALTGIIVIVIVTTAIINLKSVFND